MAQYSEGDRYNVGGAIYVYRNGRFELESSQSPTMQTRPADPRLPFQVQQSRNEAAASENDPRRAEADARRAEAEARMAEAEASGRPTPLTTQQLNALRERYLLLPGFERQLDEIEALYREGFQGQRGGIPLLGGGETNILGSDFVPDRARPINQRLRTASDSLIGTIAGIQGTTGGEMNSLAELRARFGPMLPSPGDTDATIEEKIARLRAMASDQRRAIEGQLPAPALQEVREQIDRSAGAPSVGGPAQREVSPTGEAAYATDRDAAFARFAQEAFNAGAGYDELNDLARRFQLPEFNREQVEKAIRYRDMGNRYYPDQAPGQPATIRPPTNGYREPSLSGSIAGGGTAVPREAATYAIHAGNAATAGLMPMFGDTERIRENLSMSRQDDPLAAMAGDLSGSAMAYSAGGLAANAVGRGTASALPRLSSFLRTQPGAYTAMSPRAVVGDTLYGAAQGIGENDDPISGILENVGGGIAGRAAPRMFASTISPTGGNMRSIIAEGVRPSLGQRFRGTGFLGDTLNFTEEAAQSIPIGGRMIRNMREGARRDWQQGRWNETLGELEPVRALPGAGNVGTRLPEGVRAGKPAHRYAQQQFNDAYDAVRGRLNFVEDADWNTDLAGLAQANLRLSEDHLSRFNRIFGDSVQRRIVNGQGALNGSDFKLATSEIGTHIRGLSKNPANQELIDALGTLDDALHQGARRHSPPEVVTALDATDRGYGKLVTLENASRRRLGAADTDPGDFSPSDILQLGRNEGVRGRRFLRGETPFYDEARIGRNLEDVLPSSGTSERTASMSMIDRLSPYAGTGLGAGAAGGAYMAGADPSTVAMAGAGAMALPLALRAGASVIRPRGAGADTVADFMRGTAVDDTMPLLQRYLRNIPRMGGMFGAPLTSYGLQPGF